MVPPRPGIGFNPHPHSPFGHYGFHNHGYRPQPINVFMNNGFSGFGSSLLSLGWASFGVNTVLSLVGMFLPNQLTSNWSFGAGWGGGFSGAGWSGSSFSARSTTTIKAELTDYNRIYQYKSEYGGDINKARDHLKTVIDDADKLLTEKKGEVVEGLTFGKFLNSLPKESQDAIKTLVNKKDDDKMTYGDVQDLKQRLEAHLKNGSIVKQEEFDKLFKPYEADLKYMDDLKAFKDQKEKDLNLLKKMNSFDDIDKKRDALKNELSLSPQEKAQMARLKGKIDEVRAKYNDTPDSKTNKKQRLGEELAKLEAAYTKLEEKEKAANKAINDCNQLGLKLPKKPAAPTDTKPAAPTDTKPAAPTDTKPAAPTDTKPAENQEVKKEGVKPAENQEVKKAEQVKGDDKTGKTAITVASGQKAYKKGIGYINGKSIGEVYRTESGECYNSKGARIYPARVNYDNGHYEYTYEDNNRIKKETNWTKQGNWYSTSTYDYNEKGELTKITTEYKDGRKHWYDKNHKLISFMPIGAQQAENVIQTQKITKDGKTITAIIAGPEKSEGGNAYNIATGEKIGTWTKQDGIYNVTLNSPVSKGASPGNTPTKDASAGNTPTKGKPNNQDFSRIASCI